MNETMIRGAAGIILASLIAAGPEAGASEKLRIGGPPPILHGIEWVRGDPIDIHRILGQKALLIEFWASWCPPCLLNLPWRTEVQLRFADRGFEWIAVTYESSASVRAALASYPGEIGIRIACSDGLSTRKTLEAIGVSSVPYAVIVNARGQVAWMGDSRCAEFEDVLVQILSNTWNLEHARRVHGANRTYLRETEKRIEQALTSGDGAELVEAARAAMLLEIPDEDRRLRAALLSRSSKRLLTETNWSGRFDGSALEFSRTAVEDCQWSDAQMVDIHARALFKNGHIAEAVSCQRRTLPLEWDNTRKSRYKKRLAHYERALVTEEVQTRAASNGTDDTPGANGSPAQREAEGSPGTVVDKAQAPRASHELTKHEMLEDLEHLREGMEMGYCGYDDLQWRLIGQGSSWLQRTAEFGKSLGTRSHWIVRDFGGLVLDYLALVRDYHFTFQVPGGEELWLIEPLVPYFTNLVLRKDGESVVVIKTGESEASLLGAELIGVDIVSSEQAARATPYLYPTVPVDQKLDTYLFGQFDIATPSKDLGVVFRASAPPRESLEASFRTKGGAVRRLALDLHRSRFPALRPDGSIYRPRDSDCWFAEPPRAPWPTLGAGGMCKGISMAADRMRLAPVAILDLRGNTGGDDSEAYAWCRRFTTQEYPGFTVANMRVGVRSGKERWSCPLPWGVPYPAWATLTSEHPVEPYQGRLIVISNSMVLSSGETFLRLARGIHGGVVIGENSGGCVTYGNAGIAVTMPNSGIRVTFGRTKTILPAREGFGFFPDYWLDSPDVHDAVRDLLRIMN
ncbi:MAG: redoxin family protein [Phycisphaerales bacterium]|nr:MAG: redoxin family protein [Phycisphaerales bacterium]